MCMLLSCCFLISETVELIFFKFIIVLFIYLFLADFCLRCCVQAFSSCREHGLLFLVVCGLLTAVASLVVEHGLQQLWLAGP